MLHRLTPSRTKWVGGTKATALCVQMKPFLNMDPVLGSALLSRRGAYVGGSRRAGRMHRTM